MRPKWTAPRHVSKSGKVISYCGPCFQWVKRNSQRRRGGIMKHGATKNGPTTEYRIWAAMIRRCYNERHNHYHRYGGRGIAVCDRWRTSFEAFFADMGLRPSRAHTLDRIDNDGDYEPSNCRWATWYQQATNTSRSVFTATINGETHSVNQWCRILGIGYTTVYRRIQRGYDAVTALTEPRFTSMRIPRKRFDFPDFHGRKQ